MSNRLITNTDNFSSWKAKFNAEINNQTNNYFMESALEHSGLDFVIQEGYIREGPDTSLITKTTVTLADNDTSLVCVDASTPGSEVITSFLTSAIPARDVFPLYEVTTVSGVVTVVTDKRTWLDMTVMKVHQHVEDFNTRYLGAQATPPTLDNNGDPIVAGASIYETTVGEMIIYNGSTWELEAPAGAGTAFPTQYLKVGYNFVRTDLNRKYVLTDLTPTWFELVGTEDVNNLPVSRPSLLLDFANGGLLTPKATFTRASVGTYVNSVGKLVTAAVDTPRFDHDPATLEPLGLLVEEERTNLLLHSSDMTDTEWTKSGVTASDSGTESHISGVNWQRVESSNATADVSHEIAQTSLSTTDTRGTVSGYAKKGEVDNIVFRVDSPTITDGRLRFNLTDYDSGANTALTNGNYVFDYTVIGDYVKFSLTFDTGSGLSGVKVWLQDSKDVGFGATIPVSDGLFFVGLQFEQGDFASSYIPTTTVAVTRDNDSCVVPVGSWGNQTEGSILVECDIHSNSAYRRIFQLDDGTADNRISLVQNNTPVLYPSIEDSGGGNQFTYGAVNIVPNMKIGLNYINGGDTELFADGLSVISDTGVVVPTVSALGIFGNTTGSDTSTGHIKKVYFYPKSLTSTEMMELTR